MDENELRQVAEQVADHVARRYRKKLVEAERRNDLIIGALRKAHAEIEMLRSGKNEGARV